MPTYVVEIEWPTSGTDIGMSITPNAIVRDTDDGGAPPPANDHKVVFTLFFTGGAGGDVQKDQKTSAPFEVATAAATEQIITCAPLSTDTTGTHRIVAELKKLDDTPVDSDEEQDLSASPGGRTTRDIDVPNINFEE